MTLKERVSLQKKLEYIASKGVFYDIGLGEAGIDKPSEAYILIQRVGPNPKKAYVSKSITRVFGQLYDDLQKVDDLERIQNIENARKAALGGV